MRRDGHIVWAVIIAVSANTDGRRGVLGNSEAEPFMRANSAVHRLGLDWHSLRRGQRALGHGALGHGALGHGALGHGALGHGALGHGAVIPGRQLVPSPHAPP